VRIVIPNRVRATTAPSRDLLVSRGDQTIAGVDFGLRLVNRRNAPKSRGQHLAAVDAAFATDEAVNPLAAMMEVGTARKASRGRQPR
jgi:hypothetical protein